MTASAQALTLTDVIKIIREKLGEAKEYLREMEKKRSIPRTFRRRLSAYLSAADSVIEIMSRQGMKYARQKGKGAVFENWFTGKQNLFRTPQESNPKKGRHIGTDAVWVYLRAARHETIHIRQIVVYAQRQFEVNARLLVREDKSVCIEVDQSDGTVQKFEFAPGQPLPPLRMQFLKYDVKDMPVEREQIPGQTLPLLKAVDTGEALWGFTPLTIIGQGGNEIAILDPPKLDVVTVCRNHIKTLEALIEECKSVLK